MLHYIQITEHSNYGTFKLQYIHIRVESRADDLTNCQSWFYCLPLCGAL